MSGPPAPAAVGPGATSPTRAFGASLRLVGERPGLVAVGLMGFLARGGVVLLALPVTVLPTPIGLSVVIGAFNVTAAGPTDRLAWMIVATAAVLVTALLIGQLLGVAADVVLAREAMALGPRAVTRRLVLRMLAVRLVSLAPLVLAGGWALNRLYAAGYHQLILPDDTATPLVLRILREAWDATAAVAIAWLATETIGGLAVRTVLVADTGILRALGGALRDLVRRPLATLGLGLAGLVVLAVLLGPALLASAVLWDRLRQAFDPAGPPLALAVICFLFVGSWLGALVLAGIAATWRSIAWSLTVGPSPDP